MKSERTWTFGLLDPLRSSDVLCLQDACVLSRFSRVRLFATPWAVARQTPLSMGFSGRNTGVGYRVLPQGIFLTQGWNPSLLQLLHCMWILCHRATGEAEAS